MDAAFASGRVADLVAGLMLFECLALSLLRRRTGQGIAFSRLVPMLTAGVFLVLALRGALTDAPTAQIGFALACAGIAHAVDLALRWRDAAKVEEPGKRMTHAGAMKAPGLERDR